MNNQMHFSRGIKKIILVTNIPTPYRIPLFNELSEIFQQMQIDFKVVFGASGYSRRKWKLDMSESHFSYVVLDSKNISLNYSEKAIFTYDGLFRLIHKEQPDVIITSGFSIATLKVWLSSWVAFIPYIVWSGSIMRSNQPDSFFKRLREKIFIRRAAGFIAYGSKARDYLISLGADISRISIGINTTDIHFYIENIKETSACLNYYDKKKHILYIGDLTPLKNVLKVLRIIKKLSLIRSDFILDIVGDGSDKARLQKFVHNHNLDNLIKFHGYRQKLDVVKFLAKADCFLFQTDGDVWGLVLNEAMAAGLPCIASIHAGSTYDLIIEEVTGFAMDFSITEKVTEKINWILENPSQAKKIGKNAQSFIIEHANLKRSAKGFIDAIERL